MADFRKLLNDLDISAVVLPDDKLKECRFFYELLSSESDKDKFRWLLGAFLNACYGYLEFKASYLHYAFNESETGEPVEDLEGLETLQKHIRVFKRKGKSSYIKTSGLSELTEKLYKFRNRSTHDGGIEIMQNGNALPDDFQIGMYRGDGVPALEFCMEILNFIDNLEEELDA